MELELELRSPLFPTCSFSHFKRISLKVAESYVNVLCVLEDLKVAAMGFWYVTEQKVCTR